MTGRAYHPKKLSSFTSLSRTIKVNIANSGILISNSYYSLHIGLNPLFYYTFEVYFYPLSFSIPNNSTSIKGSITSSYFPDALGKYYPEINITESTIRG